VSEPTHAARARRYARHIALADVGERGQAALLASTARLAFDDVSVARIAGAFLAAGGVGTLIVTGASPAQCAELAAHGVDTTMVSDSGRARTDHDAAREVAIPARPEWWPAADGDDVALAMWRGAMAATRWMTDTIRA
jgi:hypothetical protein